MLNNATHHCSYQTLDSRCDRCQALSSLPASSTLNPFSHISQALTDVSALSVVGFLSRFNGLEDLDLTFHLQVPTERVASLPHISQPQQIIKHSSSQSLPVLKDADDLVPLEAPVIQSSIVPVVPSKRDFSPITMLHQTCQWVFRISIKFLHFEFLEDDPKCTHSLPDSCLLLL